MDHKFIYALGFFDGVHLGHRALLDACLYLAQANDCKAGAVTFLGHPDTLVFGVTPPLINTPADRRKLLTDFGMKQIVELPFDMEMMQMPWRDFLDMLVARYGATGFVCGDDFVFGHRGLGNTARIKEYCQEHGFDCRIVHQVMYEGTVVSSTYIRTLLEAGDVETAGRFLGHPHVLSGEVVSGRRIGRTLRIPTANLLLPEGLVTLPHGVYACIAITEGQRRLAVTNIGSRPTVGGHRVTVEPWILDFDGDLYGKTLMLEFHKFLRPERKFDSLEELKAQIQSDAVQTQLFFG
jgi:riboflavin kinase/FMN adenylyltransferase